MTKPLADRLPLRLIADDLTGALDSAAPFATQKAPVAVTWSAGQRPTRRDIATSSESRGLSPSEARAAVRRCWEGMGGAATGYLWFKKVDSVLRGHPVAETAEMLARGSFASCIFAPAFPQMGRVTRSGRHWIRDQSGTWTAAAVHDIRAGFAALGIAADRRGGPGAAQARVVVIDAEQEHDLSAAVETVGRDAPVLWVGSAGLARALAGKVAPLPIPRVFRLIVGTTHPATRAQVNNLAPVLRDVHLIDPVPVACDEQDTMHQIALQVSEAKPSPSGDMTMIVGGDTLSVVLAAVDAELLLCMGEAGPGLPVADIIGGRWNGCRIVTKSGGFGAAGLLRNMVAAKPL